MSGRLSGRRIIVVEDDYFIASDLARTLGLAGAEVIGPFARVEPALAELIDSGPVDAAVLDVNLAGTLTYPIVDRLRATGTPWLFLTGYDGSSIPDAYRDAPRVTKPFVPHEIVDRVSALIGPQGTAG